MTIMLATADGGNLKYSRRDGYDFGLINVLYWKYDKFAYGEAWESLFPDTIYLVGCKPEWSIYLDCTDAPANKVYYRRGSCSTTAPSGENYVFSWDKTADCPWDKKTLCGGSEEPDNYIEGHDSELTLCVDFPDEGASLEGPWFKKQESPLYFTFRGFVDECWGSDANLQMDFSVLGGAMQGGVVGPWSGKVLNITTGGAVTFGYQFRVQWNLCTLYINYSATGTVAINPDYGMPEGAISGLTVTATLADQYWCSEFLIECPGDAGCECEAGPLAANCWISETLCNQFIIGRAASHMQLRTGERQLPLRFFRRSKEGC